MNDPEFVTRRARLEPLFESARSLADPATARGRDARQRLVRATGLSPEGVELAISRCLESAPSESDVEALIRSTPSAQVAHVLLSAHVFVAAHRAIAIGLAASERVCVRASRREPEMAELLLAGAPSSFQLVSELSPRAGDRLWAYGSDESLDEVSVTLPAGVALHAHGSGFGVCVIDEKLPDSELSELLSRLTYDVVLFDQRGCLSPRTLLVGGGPEHARDVAQALAKELSALAERVPLGRLDTAELAEITRFKDSATFAGELFAAGPGFVSAGKDETWTLPPVGRNVHVLPSTDPIKSLMNVRQMITSCAFAGDPALAKALRRTLPGARICKFGDMQSPPFDGPVDRRDL